MSPVLLIRHLLLKETVSVILVSSGVPMGSAVIQQVEFHALLIQLLAKADATATLDSNGHPMAEHALLQ